MIQEKVATLESLLAWAQTLPPEQEYNFASIDHCALHQYLSDHDVRVLYVAGDKWVSADRLMYPLPASFADISVAAPHTMDGIVKRTRAEIADRKKQKRKRKQS